MTFLFGQTGWLCRTMRRGLCLFVLAGVGVLEVEDRALAQADPPQSAEASAALRKAATFFHQRVAVRGGYVYRWSADLKLREGEGKAGPDVVWVQPPGTPAVGLAFLQAHERVPEPFLLEAARDAGMCLVRGQLHSGGWPASIDFSESGLKKFAYRSAGDPGKKNNWTTFDDNKTQSAVTFLMRLDHALGKKDAAIHEAAQFALAAILKAQYPNGAWPQGYQQFPDPSVYPVKQASYPDEWPREFPKTDYRLHYTLNDNALADTIDMLLQAARIYDEPKYREAALKGGEFILLAQMPEPQPAWAQQYDAAMHPVWARKFEPPAISGGESQGILRILQRLYLETGDAKYLRPIPAAIAYLRRSELRPGELARFYELRTNRPLYFTKQYELTHDDGDLPTHYGFKVSAKFDSLTREQERLEKATPTELARLRQKQAEPQRITRPDPKQVRDVIAKLDDRGAWVEKGQLDGQSTEGVIESRTFIKNLDLLSREIAAPR